jgi:Sec-independent protein secretion pathway component TatC
MNRRLASLLLHSYPSKWRAEYGSELEQLLCKRAFRMRDLFDVLWSGFSERIRQPFCRFAFYSLTGNAIAFLTSLVFARPLWRTLTTPVTNVLREQGVRPSFLVALRPFEQLEVVWIGIPLLVTAFVTFAWMLVLIWIFFAHVKEIQKQQWANRFVLFSGTLFLLSSLLSFVSWQNGSVAKLLELYPDLQNAPLLSVEHCFVLFALSTFGATLLLQIPVVTFFGWRFRAIKEVKPLPSS